MIKFYNYCIQFWRDWMCFSRLSYELAGFRLPYWYIFGKGADLYKDIVLSLAAMSGGLTSLLWSSLMHLKHIIILWHGVFGNIIWGTNRYSTSYITDLYYDTKYLKEIVHNSNITFWFSNFILTAFCLKGVILFYGWCVLFCREIWCSNKIELKNKNSNLKKC